MLGKKLGNKLIVIATCDPYDFLEEVDIVKNYITIYEPTVPAFKSAIDVIFGTTQAVGKLPVRSQPVKHDIRRFNKLNDEDTKHVWKLWQESFPNWQIKYQRLAQMLQRGGRHFIHDQGFCLSYPGKEPGTGSIACIAVEKSYQGRGIGTALISRARKEMRDEAFSAGLDSMKSFGINSNFPRFWPGIPTTMSSATKMFFVNRGFRKSSRLPDRDMFKSITTEIAPPEILSRVQNLPLTFSPWSAEHYEECMTKQEANFGYNQAWVRGYAALAKHNQYHEVMVAFDESGAQVGWTWMCSPECPINQEFAFIPLLPSKDKTGLIACVGVDKSARGKGFGLALLIAAMKNMRERGMEGVLIDWVAIRGFYETLGYEVYWEYDIYEW